MKVSGTVRGDRIEASQLKGSPVRGADGQLIGTIQDLVIGVPEGRVAEVIVWFHEGPEAQASYHSLPWSALRPAGAERGYVAERGAARRVEMPGEGAAILGAGVPADDAASVAG